NAKLDGTNLNGVLREGATGLPALPPRDPADAQRARDLVQALQDAHDHYDDPDQVAKRKARDEAEARDNERQMEELYRKTRQKRRAIPFELPPDAWLEIPACRYRIGLAPHEARRLAE